MGTASEVTVRSIAPSIRGLPSQPFDVLMIPGVCLWGPINTATIVMDFDDFSDTFRGYILNYETPVQVKQFFLGGGKKAIVNRIVHIDTAGAPVTAAKAYATAQTATGAPTKGSVTGTVAAPYALVNTDTLIGDIDGVGNQTLTITATAAARECTNPDPYVIVDSQTLTVKIDRGVVQTITFLTAEFVAIGAATAEEVAAVINAKIVGAQATVTAAGTKVTITSDTLGTGSYVEVTGGSANGVLAFNVAEVQGGGNVIDVTSVTIAELKTLLEAAWTNGGGVTVTDASGYINIEANTPGATGSVLVHATSTADDELGLDNATHAGTTGAAADTLKLWGKYYGGTIGNALTYDITDATNELAASFDLIIYLSGVAQPTHANLTMDSTSDDYAITRLAAESLFVTGEDMAAVGTALQRRPENAVAQALAGGDDGLAGLTDTDFIGYAGSGTGLYAFETVWPEGDIMICPDRATTTFQDAMSLYLETYKKRTSTGIPDSPAGLDDDGVITHATSLTPREVMQAVPWPNVKIPNPDKAVYGTDSLITIKPSGSIAGRMAYNTQNYKTHVATQPGNEEFGRLINVVDVETPIVKRIGVRRKVTPMHVNPIYAGKDTSNAYGVWLNDVQALKTDSNFTSIAENRLVATVLKSAIRYLETKRTTPNTESNRLRESREINAYMLQWCAREALATTNAEDAFYVNTDPKGVGINNALVRDREEYKVIIGVATAKARRFIDLGITRDQRAVEAYIQQQLTSP